MHYSQCSEEQARIALASFAVRLRGVDFTRMLNQIATNLCHLRARSTERASLYHLLRPHTFQGVSFVI